MAWDTILSRDQNLFFCNFISGTLSKKYHHVWKLSFLERNKGRKFMRMAHFPWFPTLKLYSTSPSHDWYTLFSLIILHPLNIPGEKGRNEEFLLHFLFNCGWMWWNYRDSRWEVTVSAIVLETRSPCKCIIWSSDLRYNWIETGILSFCNMMHRSKNDAEGRVIHGVHFLISRTKNDPMRKWLIDPSNDSSITCHSSFIWPTYLFLILTLASRYWPSSLIFHSIHKSILSGNEEMCLYSGAFAVMLI